MEISRSIKKGKWDQIPSKEDACVPLGIKIEHICLLNLASIKLSSCQTGPPVGSVHTFSFPDFLFYLNPQSYLPHQLVLSFWDLASSHLGYKICFWKNRAYVSRVYSRPWTKPQGSEDGSTWGPVLRALLSDGRDCGHAVHPVLWQRNSQRAVCAQRGTLTPKMEYSWIIRGHPRKRHAERDDHCRLWEGRRGAEKWG